MMKSKGAGTRFARSLVIGLLAGWGTATIAQEFPSKPIRTLVGYAPGGNPDVLARFFGQLMSPALGQSVVIENRAGAGGVPAVQELLNAPADGHTILMMDLGMYAIVPALRPSVYDPLKSFQPLGQVADDGVFIMVNNSIPVKDFKEFIALVKSRPGQISYGSAGIGSVHHLFMEAVIAAYGLNMQHIPYKGSTQTLVSLLNGDIPVAIAGVGTTQQQVKEGKLRMLAASAGERDKLVPDVPTVAEFGHPDVDFSGIQGFAVRSGTPRSAADKLSAAIAKAAQSPEFAARASGMGMNIKYRNAEQYAEFLRAAYARVQRVVKIAGIKTE